MDLSYNNRATPARKLKESCDLCSASKLRCDKQKPACARCTSLQQPCCYSPARRAGRPHRVRREKEKEREKEQQQQYSHVAMSVEGGSGSIQLMEPGRDSDQSSEMSLDNAPSLLGIAGRYNYNTRESHKQQQQQRLQSVEPSSCPASEQNSGQGDCTETAISILEHLDMARRRQGRIYAGETTTDACQRLLTILVCPCSEKPGVALLVATGCISLMDTVHHCHVGSASPELSASSTSNTPGTEQNGSPHTNMINWPPRQSSPSVLSTNQNSSQGGGVEQLAKIAKLILQFTDRYSREPKGGGAGWAHTTWLVAPIAALLRFRLQSVTHQATRSLVF